MSHNKMYNATEVLQMVYLPDGVISDDVISDDESSG